MNQPRKRREDPHTQAELEALIMKALNAMPPKGFHSQWQLKTALRKNLATKAIRNATFETALNELVRQGKIVREPRVRRAR